MDTTGPTRFLQQVEGVLRQTLISSSPLLSQAAGELVAAGGRRLRPRLVLLLAEALGIAESTAQDVAVSAELIHAASLLHDDVVDQGQTRRGRPTVNVRWGNAVAVLTGDWVLCGAMARLHAHPHQVTIRAVETVAEMSRAALTEIEARGDASFTEKAWRDMAEGKTGALLGFCGEALALIRGDAQLARRLRDFGLHLGIAFQLADDLSDLLGTAAGKDRFSDLRNGNPSLPLIRAAARDPELQRRLQQLWSWPQPPRKAVEELGAAIMEGDVVAELATELHAELEEAAASLGSLRDSVWPELQSWAAPLAEAVVRTDLRALDPARQGG